jgi:peptide/nickel transport system permease protein
MVSMAVFALSNLLPGDPAVALAGENATDDVINAIRRQLGYDRPWIVQYLVWFGNVIKWDFGQSLFMGASVTSLIVDRVPPTLSLTIFAISVAIVIGILTGLLAATHRGRPTDKLITLLSTLGIATPNFWMGMLLIIVLSFQFNLLPATGYTAFFDSPREWLMHIILPGAALGMPLAAELQRQTRSSISDVLSQDYIRTARAQGLSRAEVLWKRALKNGSGPLLTVIGFQIAILMGGSVVVEKVFSIPGLGTLMIEAVMSKDLPVIQGVVLINATFVIVINLFTDLSYKLLNPKVRIQ